jgi:hypothetical protein
MSHRYQTSQAFTPEFTPRSTSASTRRGPSFTDLIGEYNRLNMMMMDRVSQMVMDTLEPAVSRLQTRLPAPSRYHSKCKDPCGHDPCRHDSCHCTCCIAEADLVVYARLGERRVVPIIVENDRHRERQITLSLSDWTTSGGRKLPIQASLSDSQFTLEACAEKGVVLIIDTNPLNQGTVVGTTDAPTPDQPRQIDVDDCLVVYADLRVEGCGIRPVRVALAFLPRDCSPFEIHCHCSCCD